MNADTQAKFSKFIDWTWTLDLRASEVRVLGAVILAGNGHRWVEYTLEDLCEQTKLSESAVTKAIHKLTQLSVLERRHSTAQDYGTGRSANAYRVEWEPESITRNPVRTTNERD